MTAVRLLCYNVRSLRDDATAVVRVIRSVAPDVALIQEAPRFFRSRSKCDALAREAGMTLVCGGRGTGANLVLTATSNEVVTAREVAFSPYRNLHRRGAAVAVLRKGAATFAVAGTHLDLIEVPRLLHLDELQGAAAGVVGEGTPLIVAGDMNAVPGSATWRRLERFGTDAWAVAGEGSGFSYPSKDAVRRIDGVFVPSAVTVIRAALLDTDDVHRASDHKPLAVELEL